MAVTPAGGFRPGTESFQVGDWKVDPAAGILIRGAAEVHLQPKLMELLLFLVENHDRVVLKQEILDTLWADAHVSEVALPRSVCQLRSLLGDHTATPTFIQTIPKRGYRLIAPISFPKSEIRRRNFPLSIVAAVATGLLVLSVGTFLLLWLSMGREPSLPSIAVLPFVYLGPNSERDHVGEDISNEILAALSNATSLRVKSGSSPSSLQDFPMRIPAIARDLEVETILTGSVRRTGERLSIAAHLVDGRTESHIWAAVYEREVSEVTEACWQLARGVASALRVEFDKSGDASPTIAGTANPEAYKLAALARYFRYREAEAGNFERAIDYYHRAIKEDPNYALAYAGLAQAFLGLDQWGATRTWMEEAEESAARALDLDRSLPDAHVARGMLLTLYHRDFAGAEASFRRALALDPHHAEAHRKYGLLLLRYLGRLDEALDELRRAHLLDPLLPPFISSLAEAHRMRGEYDRALERLMSRIDIDPRTARGLTNVAYTYFAMADYSSAVEWCRKALALEPGFPPALQLQIHILLPADRPDRVAEAARQLLDLHPEDPQSLAAAGLAALRMGDMIQAREHVEKAYRISPLGWAWPSDVRFATLLGFLLLEKGERVRAEQLLSQSLRLDGEVVPGPLNRPLPSWLYNSALVYAVRGESERACRFLHRAVEAGWRAWSFDHGHPLWGGLRDTSCFRELAHEIEADLARMREQVVSFGPMLETVGARTSSSLVER